MNRTDQGPDGAIGGRKVAGAASTTLRPPTFRFAPAAGLAGLGLRLAAGMRRLGEAIDEDLDAGLGFPLLVVGFAFGAGFSFLAPAEPWWPATIALAAVPLVATVILRRRGHAVRGLALAAAIAAGYAAGAIETARVAAPRLDHERTVTVTGRVTDLDATARGGTRIELAVARMEAKGLAPDATPRRIAATLPGRGHAAAPAVGDAVGFLARLKPPEGPVLPGGYDFARRAWFEGRGASGYVLGRVKPADLGPPSFVDRMLAPIGVLRHAIAERVRAGLPGAAGAIGAAIMVGEQRAIPDAANEALRASGLTHIVSISGLHMSLVAGGVMGVVRLMLALVPAIALRFPIRKWAAAAAILAATIYLLLSGNQVAALRSHLMLTIALLAVILDRPALTMHTIAVSAAAILVVDPSAALEPSFQMSYLAVIALVASWDLWRLWLERRPPPTREAGLVARGLAGAVLHVQGLAFSSLIAGLATAPVIAGVFYRGAPYSILANMIVLPVTGLLIMPAAVIAALAMPLGLDPWPLAAMGAGIDFMVAVGAWVSAFPGGAGLIGLPHPAMMPAGIVAVLWLSVFRSRFRLLGLVPAIAAGILLFVGPRPDVFVGRHGAPVAVRGVDGRLAVLATRQDRFDAAIWLAADADSRSPDTPGLGEGWHCDPLGCVYRRPMPETERSARRGAGEPRPERFGDGVAEAEVPEVVIAVVRHPRGFDEDCRRASLIVTALAAPADCRRRTMVIDRTDLVTDGATTLRFAGALPTVAAIGRPVAPASVDPTDDEAEPAGQGEGATVASTEAGSAVTATEASAPPSIAAPEVAPRRNAIAAGREPTGIDDPATVGGRPGGMRDPVATEPRPSAEGQVVGATTLRQLPMAVVSRGGAIARSVPAAAPAPETGRLTGSGGPAPITHTADAASALSAAETPAASSTHVAAPVPAAADEFDPPPARVRFERTVSLPHPPRAWTPIAPGGGASSGAQQARAEPARSARTKPAVGVAATPAEVGSRRHPADPASPAVEDAPTTGDGTEPSAGDDRPPSSPGAPPSPTDDP